MTKRRQHRRWQAGLWVLAGLLSAGLILAGCGKTTSQGQHDQMATGQQGQSGNSQSHQMTGDQMGQMSQSAAQSGQSNSQDGGQAAAQNGQGTTGQTAGAGQTSTAQDTISVEQAWARPAKTSADMGSSSAAYFVLKNNGTQDDALVGVSTDVAMAEMHESVMGENGAMTMRPVQKIALPAGATVELKPGGLHIMLMDLKRELAVGEKFQLTLKLEKGGAKTVEVEVRNP